MQTDDDDAKLVALIDDELGPAEAKSLRERLASDAALRARYEALKNADPLIAGAFDTLLEGAPTQRLQAALASAPSGAPSGPRARWRDFAAGLAVGLVIAGLAAFAWRAAIAPGEAENWRTAVVEYVSLYTPETFAAFNPDAAQEAGALGALEAKLGGGLTPARIAIEGLRFKGAVIFEYDGAPLGQIAFAGADGVPVVFCVIRSAAAEAPLATEKRDGLSLASWARGGRGYMVVARLPNDKVAAVAETLAQRF